MKTIAIEKKTIDKKCLYLEKKNRTCVILEKKN